MKNRQRKIVQTAKPTKAESIRIFFQTARLDLIAGIRASCRKRFPQTVAFLDGLSALETEAIRNGGLLALPKPKRSELEKAMMKDDFVWS